MNPEALQAQLADIHLPADPGWWPPAPGWWIVALLTLTVIVGGAIWLLRNYRQRAWQRAALVELDHLSANTDQALHCLEALDRLLRRVAGVNAMAEFRADLSGDAWQAWLIKQQLGSEQQCRWLAHSRYSPEALPDAVEMQQLLLCCRQWLQQAHRRPHSA